MTKDVHPPLSSEIIYNKKQLVLIVDQTSDYTYPNKLYKYQIYCKNVSGETIDNVHIQIINPSTVLIDEDNEVPPEGVNIGDLKNGQSHLLNVKARCATTGKFTVHFVCFGDGSEVVTKKATIISNYDAYNNKNIHRVHIYNFTPYQEKYELQSKDYSDEVTQLVKKQYLPYKAKENPFKMISSNENQGFFIDESQNYLDQKDILYGNPVEGDLHSYQYLGRENFNRDDVEVYEGENLFEIFQDINKKSKLFRARFLRTGSNQLLNDFRQYNPDGFIYRVGLMSSELFHHLGVLPDYSYMNDYLFRWANEGGLPLNLYPKRLDMNWRSNRWSGHGWRVWKTYTDEYKALIINDPDYKPMMEHVDTFELLETAEEYVKTEEEHDISNEYYVNTEDGLEQIKKYQYLIKETYNDTGVFFIHIPVSKIPSNFLMLNIEDIEAIVEKTKPYGMKALIRYVIDTHFNMNISMNVTTKVYPRVPFEIKDFNRFNYAMIPYEYHNVTEEVCYVEDETRKTEQRTSLKKIPSGTAYDRTVDFNIDPSISKISTEPSTKSDLELIPQIETQTYACHLDTELVSLDNLYNLLEANNFDAISFKIDKINTRELAYEKEAEILVEEGIKAVNYKLWKDSLFDENGQINNNPHSYWWDTEKLMKDYVDFIEIPLTTYQITRDGIESGIGFRDEYGKLHGFSAEYDSQLESFKIKYATSLNNNFKIRKEGIANITGLAYKFVEIDGKTLVILFIKKVKDTKIEYHYFDHVVITKMKNNFAFIRNERDISALRNWTKFIQCGRKTNSKVAFNTPQFDQSKTVSPNYILNNENTNWHKIHRIDKNEESYALITNDSQELLQPDNIRLHFDDINIPNDAVIKSVKVKSILETNSYKSMYPSIRIQDGFITEQSSSNKVCLQPQYITAYPSHNKSTEYYEGRYKEAESEESEGSMEFFKNKIIENLLFSDYVTYDTEFLDNVDDFITVNKPYWIEVSDFCDYETFIEKTEDCVLFLEGYNPGKEVYVKAQPFQYEMFGVPTEKLIPKGYFKISIPLNNLSIFVLERLSVRFRFLGLCDDLRIFDAYLSTTFHDKQQEPKAFEERDSIDVEKKKIVRQELLLKEENGYTLNNGFTLDLSFDELELGEYYRIYSIELEIIYQNQNIDLLVSSNNYSILNSKNKMTSISGKSTDAYIGGLFFNELIMAGTYQPTSTLNSEDQGVELEQALYQSFIATADNMTSFTIFPNGFVGNPDVNLKISLYENKGNTPNRLVKEIRAKGWSKQNKNLKNASIITYDFNVNNLVVGNKYWIKIEVENPSEGNYYLLKYNNSSEKNIRLLLDINDNLINTFGSLTFYVNTINKYHSFNSFPSCELDPELSDPKIFVGLHKRSGELSDIKIKKNR